MVKVKNVLLGVLLLLGGEAFCADPPAPSGGAGVPPPPGLPLPIDDHLPLLMIAGIFLGIFFLKKTRKIS